MRDATSADAAPAPSLLARTVAAQRRLSRRIDALVPARHRIDGNRDFIDRVVPQHLAPGLRIVDVGGGRTPLLDPARKRALGVHVTGLDIDGDALAAAPSGAYDATIEADICRYRGRPDADLVICQALLEHVPDVAAALAGLASMLKPGGTALVFVPSRHALFARLNLLLPESLKKRVLYALLPESRGTQGFRAFYDRCTPREMRALGQRAGLETTETRTYFQSGYFTVLAPAHALWRTWMLAYEAVRGEQAAETFVLTLRKQDGAGRPPTT